MRHRIGQAVGNDKAALMTISTFHSLCSRLIRANPEMLGLTKNYTIYDTDDQERLLKTCIAKFEDPGGSGNFKISKEYMRTLVSFIEGKRNACLNDAQALDRYDIFGNQASVAAEYFTQLRKSNAVDFTGLLSETNRLFTEHSDIRDKYRNRFKYISVDEVQDTNIAQYELIKHLGLGHGNVLIVGDLDQSIYKFRDACPENILQFEKDFANCKVLFLEKNYRSTPSILSHSQKLIEHNTLRKGTKLLTDNADGDPPKVIVSETDLSMAEDIAASIEAKIKSGIKPKEIAILYRTNFASRVLERALRDHQIKYRIIGGMSFWDRKEVKQGLAILKMLCNENDRMAFEKSAEACCRGVGEKAFGAITEIAQTRGITVMAAAKTFASVGNASGRALSPLVKAIDSCHGILPGQTLLKISQMTAFWSRLASDSTDTNDRCGNLLEMVSDADEYCSKPKNTLSGYLQNISLLTSADEKDDDDSMIRLMTLHGCKGLEFDAVYISHCNSYMLPHSRMAGESSNYPAAVEEERRLLYVGMTRARKSLALCLSKSKIDARSRNPVAQFASPFIKETGIPCPDIDDIMPDDDILTTPPNSKKDDQD